MQSGQALDCISFVKAFNTGGYSVSMIQDRDGFIWIAGSTGLVRYDGLGTRNFRVGSSQVASSYTACVFEDNGGTLWVSTLGGGLYRVEKKGGMPKAFRRMDMDPDTTAPQRFNLAGHIIDQDSRGNLWIGTRNGLGRFDRETETFKMFRHSPSDPKSLSHNSIWAVFVDSDDTVWVGTKDGLDAFDPGLSQFTRYAHDPELKNSIDPGRVCAIEQGIGNTLWIGTAQGHLNLFHPRSGQAEGYGGTDIFPAEIGDVGIFSITRDETGRLWISRPDPSAGGLEIFNPDTGTSRVFRHHTKDPGALSGNLPAACMQDGSGIMWVLGSRGHVDKYDPWNKCFGFLYHDPKDPQSLGGNTVLAITEDQDGHVWLATHMGGLNRLNPDGRIDRFLADPDRLPGILENYVTSVFVDRDNRLWVALKDGRFGIFDPAESRFKSLYQCLTKSAAPLGLICQKKQRTVDRLLDQNPRTEYPAVIWFGTKADGLFRFDTEKKSFSRFLADPENPRALKSNHVLNLFEDEAGTLWVMTLGGGLSRFEPESDDFVTFMADSANLNAIGGNIVTDCHVDRAGQFWVATSDGGLNLFSRKEERFTAFGAERGFHTLSVRAILEDDTGHLWLGTDSGLIQFDPEDKSVMAVYTAADGIQNDQFLLSSTSAYRSRDGRMWFASLDGVTCFDPGRILKNTHAPPVALISVTQNESPLMTGQPGMVPEKISLGWRQNYFEFEFAALSFSRPEKNRYAYFLDGFEKGWTDSGTHRSGKYTNLPEAGTPFACLPPTVTASGTKKASPSPWRSRQNPGKPGGHI